MSVEIDENELVEEEHYAMAGPEHRDVISRLYEGLKLVYIDRTDRLVMAEVDLYPPGARVKMIPDVAIVRGLPQYRVEAYRVGETGPPPSIVLEVVSRYENEDARRRKLERYGSMGVEEVWFLHLHPAGSVRYRMVDAVWQLDSPRVCDLLDGVSFASVDGELEPRFADGTPFPESMAAVAVEAQAEAARAEAEVERARDESARAEADVERAEAEAARARAEAGRAERLALRLRELGVDPDTV